MTKFPDFWRALASPFDQQEIKTRPQGGRQLKYVTARSVMNRLDEVAGPENWWDEYHQSERSVVCKLSLRLPDGQVLTKTDIGGCAGMQDEGDDDKSGFSDAFKRAAVKFGIGRHLYGDGIASFPERPSPASQAPLGNIAKPADRPTPAPPATPKRNASQSALVELDSWPVGDSQERFNELKDLLYRFVDQELKDNPFAATLWGFFWWVAKWAISNKVVEASLDGLKNSDVLCIATDCLSIKGAYWMRRQIDNYKSMKYNQTMSNDREASNNGLARVG